MDLEAAIHETHGDAPEHSETIIDASGLPTEHSEEGRPPRIPIIEVVFGEASVTTEQVNAANRDNSGGLHSADSPNPDAIAKSNSIDDTGNTASIRKVALASDTEHGGAMAALCIKADCTEALRQATLYFFRQKTSLFHIRSCGVSAHANEFA